MSATNLFARGASDGRQYLAYSMTLSAEDDLAMILPLPVPRDTMEDGVAFIDLSAYAQFFTDLAKGFPEPVSGYVDLSRRGPGRRAPLAVVEVGSFEASFVPTIGDFGRLDPRFRLPAAVWSLLPGYDRFGFAVFKLKKGNKRIHPMAFSFPRAASESLFFPTVHIHDGQVHPVANFDHALFCQRKPGAHGALPDAWRSSSNARHFVDVERTRGIVDGDSPVHRLRLKGARPNRDVYMED